MRKTAAVASVLMLVASLSAGAEGLVVRGGLTYQKGSSVKDARLDNYTSWHIGAGYQTGTLAGFSLQPEVVYNVKGVTLNDVTAVRMNYLEVPVNIQWGIDLLIARPFVFASPYIGYSLGHKYTAADSLNEQIEKVLNKAEYGIGLGAGLELGRFQFTAKYNWEFGHLYDVDTYVEDLKNLDVDKGCVQISVGLSF